MQTVSSDILSAKRASDLLVPFGVTLSAIQLDRLLAYLGVLRLWKQRINLTAVRDPAECLTRHFGESLYLSRWVDLRGRSLDVGSGAGFPGLALKIVAPDLDVVLLEPVAKKRAFLKEVTRVCKLESVEVRAERYESYA